MKQVTVRLSDKTPPSIIWDDDTAPDDVVLYCAGAKEPGILQIEAEYQPVLGQAAIVVTWMPSFGRIFLPSSRARTAEFRPLYGSTGPSPSTMMTRRPAWTIHHSNSNRPFV